MKKIRFTKTYNQFQAGHVIGTNNRDAAALVSAGVAVYVEESVRPLKYAANRPVQTECIAPIVEELEAPPKGAVIPPSYEVPEADTTLETKIVKPNKKKQKTNT